MDAKASPSRWIADLAATDLRDRLAGGALRAVEVAEAFLEQVAAGEETVQAWAWLDAGHVLEQARTLDAQRASGRPIGALHGLPVGIKDIIDTAGIATENGTVVDRGRVPDRDAYVVRCLKRAGAVIMGKTVTTELAFMAPNKTRNPHDPAHTPGGSSSGSAAAVAAAMVPLAIGTQTGGSVIRPAAFCGVAGFKPTFGAIPRTGVLSQSPTLDTLGVFARTPADAALLADALFGDDPGDPATMPGPPPRLSPTVDAGPPLPPVLAMVRPPGWDQADPQTRDAFAELLGRLGEACFEVDLPSPFDQAVEQRRIINLAEMAKCFYSYERRGYDQLCVETREALDAGKTLAARDYLAALDWRPVLNAGLAPIFERCDAIVAPAALGPAPAGLASTGDSIFNGLWTLCGTPAVTVPLLHADNGLPMGVQLVGRAGDDARLLRTAQWLYGHLTAP